MEDEPRFDRGVCETRVRDLVDEAEVYLNRGEYESAANSLSNAAIWARLAKFAPEP